MFLLSASIPHDGLIEMQPAKAPDPELTGHGLVINYLRV
jgi:hypothetical protein